MSENNTFSGNDKNSDLLGSSLLDSLYIIAKARKFLLIFISLAIVTALVIALVKEKQFKATASVLPADQTDILSSMSGLSSLAKNFSPFKGLSSIAGTDELDKYIAILKSKSVQRDVIKEFNLRKVYDMVDKPQWKVEEEFTDNVEFNIEDEGNLTITVFDSSPKRAAFIANYMVQLLNKINTELHITNARASREFIERRYFQNLNDITSYEKDMKNFQEKYGVIAVPEQIEATIKTVAELYANLTKEEIELNVLKQTLSDGNPILRTKEIQLVEMRREFNKMKNSSSTVENDPKVLIPLNMAPDLAGKYFNIFKNLEIQYKIAEFITPVYEQAKIEEARNTPSVLILDKAYPSERKAKPKISLFLLIAFVASLITGLIIVFTKELFFKMYILNPQKYSYISNSFTPFKRNAN